MELTATIIMAGMLAAAVTADLRTGKVPNKLTLPCAGAGLALAAAAGGISGLGNHLLGAAMVLGAYLILSTIMPLGGGDAKLLMAVGALQGFPFALWAMLLTGVAGGGLALVEVLRRRALKQTAVNMAANMLLNAGGVPTDVAAGSRLSKIPYSIAIALGSLAALGLGM